MLSLFKVSLKNIMRFHLKTNEGWGRAQPLDTYYAIKVPCSASSTCLKSWALYCKLLISAMGKQRLVDSQDFLGRQLSLIREPQVPGRDPISNKPSRWLQRRPHDANIPAHDHLPHKHKHIPPKMESSKLLFLFVLHTYILFYQFL